MSVCESVTGNNRPRLRRGGGKPPSAAGRFLRERLRLMAARAASEPRRGPASLRRSANAPPETQNEQKLKI